MGRARESLLTVSRLVLKIRKKKINFGGLGGGISFKQLQVMQGRGIVER